MTDSLHKKIVDKLEELMKSIEGKVTVEVNTPLPEKVPADGLIIVRDGRPNPSTETLGGFDTAYVMATFPIEVYVTHGDREKRDVKYDELLQAVGAKLMQRDANDQRTLGGLVHGLIIDRPDPITEPIPGAAAVKAATIKVRMEYSAPSVLG